MPVEDSEFSIEWDPCKYAIAYERFRHPTNEGRGSLVVRHFTAPFVVTGLSDGDLTDASFQRYGHKYLKRLNEFLMHHHENGLELPKSWWRALEPDTFEKPFGWLRIEPPFSGPALTDPVLSSFRLTRQSSECVEDTSVILVAAESVGDHGHRRALNTVFGLEIVVHLVPVKSKWNLQISAVTVHYPYGLYRTAVEIEDSPEHQLTSLTPLESLLSKKETEIASLSQLRVPLTYEQVLFLDTQPLSVEMRGSGVDALRRRDQAFDRDDAAGDGDGPLTYGFATRLLATEDNHVLEPVARYARVAKASEEAHPRVFRQDPASWRDRHALDCPPAPYEWYATRPVRSDGVLDHFRVPVDVEAELDRFPRPPGCKSDTEIRLETDYFVVRKCPKFVPTDHGAGVKTVSRPWPAVRSNDLSAIDAALNCCELFRTLCGFGLDPGQYFRRTSGRLEVFYRSGVWPGPGASGETINARVTLDAGSSPDGSGLFPKHGPRISLHLALANRTCRARPVPPDGRPTWAEPLGIANSERWMWHEFGHVLIAARLGTLEFQFAHSIGDALAAVFADPFSRLADPRNIANPPGIGNAREISERFRGITYPWVFLTRRHDRCVLNGWSWSGSFQRPVIEASEHDRRGRKGYLSEQILSSTLFRLYRILGGDTDDTNDDAPDYKTRESASKVVIYFIMRALEMFAISPLRAEEFAAALGDADLGLTTPLALELRRGCVHSWTGGQAHKVIRWSFEAQGMYAHDHDGKHGQDPDIIHNAPGAPPPVDIYIEDRRPRCEQTDGGIVHYGPGGYVPVSLDWGDGAEWLASEDAVCVDVAQGVVRVAVRNRGFKEAHGVSVRIWIGTVHPSDWDKDPGGEREACIHWHGPFALSPPDHKIPPGQYAAFTSDRLEFPEKSILIAVEATCCDDRANSDPAARLPCAVPHSPPNTPRTLTDLVANDNNLALRMLS